MTRLVLTNANLLDGEHPAVAGSTVVIEGDRIAAAGQGAAAAAQPGDDVHDLGGRTLMPGMVTCHFHSAYHELGSKMTPLGSDVPPAYAAVIAARNLRIALECGYTGAIGAGVAHDIDASMKRAIEDGVIPGPRLVPASRELSTTGHSNDNHPWWWNVPSAGGIRLCDGPAEFRAGVRDEIKHGAEIIKLYVTGGHGTTAPKSQTELTRDELAAAIDTAHSRGALIRGHISNKEAILMCVELGMDILDHADDMDDECIERIVAAGTYVVPSLYFPKHFSETMGAGLGFGDAMKADLAYSYEVLPKAQAAGVRFLVGDDYGAIGFPHGMYGGELSLYVDTVGIAPLDVLRWATVNGAAAMGRGHELGTVREGMLADLLVVDGDPSTDISVLADRSKIVTVVKGGEVASGELPV
jgi:imidazolonepropionase-like amidohydrolase